MVRSTSSYKWHKAITRPRARVLAVVLLAGVSVSPGSARAGLFGEDIPILIEIAATEASSYGELGAILAQATALVAQVKEYTSLAKVAWGAIEELRQMTAAQLGAYAKAGLENAFPEIGIMYEDINDIGDLSYRDPRAYQALKGFLWDKLYGPAIDFLHFGHERMGQAADMREYEVRQEAKILARRAEAEQWEEDCRRTGAGGTEGACQAAANRAAIQETLLLADVHETTVKMMAAQRADLELQDRRELDEIYAVRRWMFDLEQFLVAVSGDPDGLCTGGQCVYEQYKDEMHNRIGEYRSRHPRRFSYELNAHRYTDPEDEDN